MTQRRRHHENVYSQPLKPVTVAAQELFLDLMRSPMAEEGEQESPSKLFVHVFPQNHVPQGLGKLRSAKPATYGAAMASLHHPVSHSTAGEETVSPSGSWCH